MATEVPHQLAAVAVSNRSASSVLQKRVMHDTLAAVATKRVKGGA